MSQSIIIALECFVFPFTRKMTPTTVKDNSKTAPREILTGINQVMFDSVEFVLLKLSLCPLDTSADPHDVLFLYDSIITAVKLKHCSTSKLSTKYSVSALNTETEMSRA